MINEEDGLRGLIDINNKPLDAAAPDDDKEQEAHFPQSFCSSKSQDEWPQWYIKDIKSFIIPLIIIMVIRITFINLLEIVKLIILTILFYRIVVIK